ncbi:hypothetical protein, partial [Ensifer canadensis]|uniref:hypothetical protein n=1 Tax=Ensifer canadensis TaxID=555315 RepID=UPI00193F05D6
DGVLSEINILQRMFENISQRFHQFSPWQMNAGEKASCGGIVPVRVSKIPNTRTTGRKGSARISRKRKSSSLCKKKGRGETAPTFLIIAYQPVPVHPWSKV